MTDQVDESLSQRKINNLQHRLKDAQQDQQVLTELVTSLKSGTPIEEAAETIGSKTLRYFSRIPTSTVTATANLRSINHRICKYLRKLDELRA